MRFFITLCAISCHLLIHATTFNKSTGAKQAGMSGFSITIADAFALHNNIASSALLPNSALALALDNRFLFANIHQAQSAFVWKLKKIGSFSIGNNFLGYTSFYHHTSKIGYARSFGNQFSAGISFAHHTLSIAENGSKHAVSFDLGIQYNPTETISIGISLKNPIKHKLEKAYNETLESVFQIGISYRPDDKFLIGLQCNKDLQYPLQVQLGTEYHLHKILFLRAGAAIHPTSFSTGLGLQCKNLQIDFSSSWNIHVGFSPQISMQYDIPSKKN